MLLIVGGPVGPTVVLGVGGPAGPTVVFGLFVVFDKIMSEHAAPTSWLRRIMLLWERRPAAMLLIVGGPVGPTVVFGVFEKINS